MQDFAWNDYVFLFFFFFFFFIVYLLAQYCKQRLIRGKKIPRILHAILLDIVSTSQRKMIDPTIRQCRCVHTCCIEFQHFARQHIYDDMMQNPIHSDFLSSSIFSANTTEHHAMKMSSSNNNNNATHEFTCLMDYSNEFDSRHLHAVEFSVFYSKLGCHCGLLLLPFYVRFFPLLPTQFFHNKTKLNSRN